MPTSDMDMVDFLRLVEKEAAEPTIHDYKTGRWHLTDGEKKGENKANDEDETYSLGTSLGAR